MEGDRAGGCRCEAPALPLLRACVSYSLALVSLHWHPTYTQPNLPRSYLHESMRVFLTGATGAGQFLNHRSRRA
jgi:hypothetical protein